MADSDAAMNMETNRIDQLAGVILGTAVGDALGLPREGLSCRRARKRFGDPPLHHTLLFDRGMASDDTEYACMTGQALLRAPDDADDFARSLAWRVRFWLLGLPVGTGRATLRSVLKLWLGYRRHAAVSGRRATAPPCGLHSWASAWGRIGTACAPMSAPRPV